jgi:HlyD family secretion protein
MKMQSKTRKRALYVGLGLAVIIVIAVVLFESSRLTQKDQYQFAEITKGTLESTISSTGTLVPVTQVEVGTQVSGIIDRVLVDFNDQVKKGQVLAVLDTVLLRVAVNDAESGVKKAAAQLEEAQENYKRSKDLYDRQMLSQADLLTVKVALRTAEATLGSAQASLDRARQNFRYAIIRSPIDGTVTARTVEAGQTVAASFSTPTLFTIAEDLSKMEILALVDESDIGQIRQGQEVRFDVQAYAGKKFTGTVKQIRLQPTTVSNVVNYTVVIEASNPEHLLLPGMTATIDFVVDRKSDVLLLPNAAFRFQPGEAEVERATQRMRDQMASLPDSVRNGMRARRGSRGEQGGDMSAQRSSSDIRTVWYLDDRGLLATARVVTGMTDGTNTEIVRARNLKEGSKVITGTVQAGETASRNVGSPSRPPTFGPRGF